MRHNWLVRLYYRIRGRDPLAEYYDWLIQFGRVTEGRVLDSLQDDSGVTAIFYRYNVANVDYETSQKLTAAQMVRGQLFVPGASITVRYDPKSPGNSIVP